jgi:hypothetical protein
MLHKGESWKNRLSRSRSIVCAAVIPKLGKASRRESASCSEASCAGCGSTITEAEEIVRDCLFVAWRRLDAVRDPQRVGTWMRTVARNRFLSLLRRRAPKELGLESAADACVVDPPIEDGLPGVLRVEVRRLSNRKRLIIELRVLGGLTSEEVERMTGIRANVSGVVSTTLWPKCVPVSGSATDAGPTVVERSIGDTRMKRLQAVLVVCVVAMSAFGRPEGKTLLDIAMKRLSVAGHASAKAAPRICERACPISIGRRPPRREGSLEGARAISKRVDSRKRLEAYAEADVRDRRSPRLQASFSASPSTPCHELREAEVSPIASRGRRERRPRRGARRSSGRNARRARGSRSPRVPSPSRAALDRRASRAHEMLSTTTSNTWNGRPRSTARPSSRWKCRKANTDVARRAFSVNAARIERLRASA